MNILSKNNSKLKKDNIVTMSLLPGVTCVNCRVNCYAVRICERYPNVTKKWSKNTDLAINNLPEFDRQLREDLIKLKADTKVRLHTSGDFFNQNYLDCWVKIMNDFSNLSFYFYTKALHLDFTKLPKNAIMIQSLGGEFDHFIDKMKPIAKLFKTQEEMDKEEYTNGSESDFIAATGTNRIGLLVH